MRERLSGPARLRALISGTVQMVGFRAFAQIRAGTYGLTGYVCNLPTGEVEVVAEGDRKLLERFLSDLRQGPRGARVRSVTVSWEAARGEHDEFAVRYGGW